MDHRSPSGVPRRRHAAVLVSGTSFAGLAIAYWMNALGYRVTVVEVAGGLADGYDGRTDIASAFRTEGEIAYDYRDRGQQRRMVQTISTGSAGRCRTCSAM